jgi:AraC-like DNA-binding protein
MDRHLLEGATKEAVADAHSKDLEIQHEFNCKAIMYWLDEERGCAFCLIDAPSEKEVKEMHEKAHGLVPNEIIKVDSNIVQSFLGRIQDPEDVKYQTHNGHQLKIFSDTAYRVIATIQTQNNVLLKKEVGLDASKNLLSNCNTIIREKIIKYEGSEVEYDGSDFIISFQSAKRAVLCVLEIQKSTRTQCKEIRLKIGIHAGNPVDESGLLFGETIRFNRFLCGIADEYPIIISTTIKKLLENSNETIHEKLDVLKWLSPTEEQFLTLLTETLHENWEDATFDISQFCSHVSQSKSQLYRKCINATGISPNNLLREFRLSQALQKLGKTNQNISEVAFEVGFNSPSYFTKCFYKKFGMKPSDYVNMNL